MPFYPPNPGQVPYQTYHGPYQPRGRRHLLYAASHQLYTNPREPYADSYQSFGYGSAQPPYSGFYPSNPMQPYRRRSGLKMQPESFIQEVSAWLPQESFSQQKPKTWENLNQIVASIGEITNGINALKQVSSLFNTLR